ncbi:DNA translocase FtsK [uncultured Gemmiger sp.]|uniref:DNA translocase FtsK n=1 Tax=uncultured Gemmiger sp. TaxID=1623490 RepID=UPI00280581D9|nr:DNA translocase FtsK [uncultured Gemmiger sp.]
MAQSRSGKSSGNKNRSSSSSKSKSRSSSSRSSTTYRASSGKSGQSSSSRSKAQASRRAQRRAETPNLARSILLAGLGLLCVAMVLVPGQNMWKTLRGGLFGIFGVMTYLVGPFLLYLAYLLASGYRVTLFAGKVALMSVLCAGVPVIFSNVSLNDANPWQITKMLFARGQTNFWEGGVWGAPVGGTLLALFGRPASNVIMLLVFLLGLMFFFAITPADVVLFVNNQYQKLQQARQDRAEEETSYDTQLFAQEQEEEPIENLTAPVQDNRPHHPAYDVIADTGRIPVQPAQPVQPLVQQAAPVNQPAQPVQPAIPSQHAASAPVIPNYTPAPTYAAYAAAAGYTPASYGTPAAESQPRASFDVDLGPEATASAAKAAIEHDPLEPVNIGPGGTFGMDPLSHLSDTSHYHAATADPQPAVQPAADEFELKLDDPAEAAPEEAAGDELDNLISRAVSGHAPYYGEQDVSSETTLDLPQESEFSVPLTPEPTFDTPLVPVEDDASFGIPVDGEEGAFTGTTPAEEPHSAPAASAAQTIPTIGGSFSVNEAVSDAWNSGRPISDVLNAQPATPVPQAAPVVPASSVAAAVSAQPQQPTGTESSFVVPQRGEAAHLQVSTSVGNSASAPISSPPSAAKADPNTMNLAAMQAEPVEPYCYPSLNLFNATRPDDEAGAAREMKKNADILVNTLDSFGVKTTMLDICRGPSVTRYELQPQAGIKVSRITSLADDIALNLATAGVRIEAPIPGKPAVGIEVPNKIRSTVNIRAVFESQNYINMRSPLTMALGKDIAGAAQVADLCKMPHLLIAGSTGSGKSVCVNSIIISFLFRSSPEDVKLILIDPKVVELAEYNGIPHLLMPVVTEPRKAAGALGASVAEMERRYKLFAENNVREIKAYNKLAAQTGLEHLPYIAIVIDELADLMMVAGKEVEDYICRIAQKARAAGIHLIVATQRPSVDVITGLIKANIPSRIAFAVSSQIDSRTILDASGAEKLLGNGDMLFLPVGASKPVRVQGTFVTDEEIGAVLSFIKSTSSTQYDEEMIAEMERRAVAEKGSKKGSDDDGDTGGALDPMFEQAVECVIDAGQASTSLLQRRCKLGYARAARIMDQMEQEKIIGPYEGAKPRTVLVSKAQWEERKLNGQYDEA